MRLSEPSPVATASAAIKENTQLAADLWRSLAGAKYFWRAGASAWRRICCPTFYASYSSGLLSSPCPAHNNCRASQNSPYKIASPRPRPERPRSPCRPRCFFTLSSPLHGHTRVRHCGPCRSAYNSTLRPSQHTQSKLASSSLELQTTPWTRACTRSPCKRANWGGRTPTGRLPPAPETMRRTRSS